jgi:NAD(P)-dependent dehydrogenase (short-subunit alcohol dehydrogenase family)
MNEPMTLLIAGGTAGIGRELARHYAGGGHTVVLTGRDRQRAENVAKEIGGDTRGIDLDLSRPADIAGSLSGIDRVDHVILAAIERDQNTVTDYDVDRATRLVTLKLVGYTEVVHTMVPRLSRDGSVVLFGGQAKDRPYPGSTTVSTINGGVVGLVHSLATELAPIRVNGIHPGIVGDSPFWIERAEAVERTVARTPTGRTVTMGDIVDAVDFLVRNRSVNGANLPVDGGWLLL